MASRETRSTVVKQVGDSKVNAKATDVPEVKKENYKHGDSTSDIELKKPTGRARTRKTTETTEESGEGNPLLHSRNARFRSASLPPVSRESLSPKANRKLRAVKVCQQQNGVKSHVNPYHTRSDTPIHILRSGKQRSSVLGWVFDDGSVPLEYRKARRRTTSAAKDKTPDDDAVSLNSKVDSPAGAESDISTCNSPLPELNKLSVSDVENDIKMPGLCSTDIKSEDSFVQETRSEGDQSEISSDSNLGKTISHKISALIKRGQVSQILQQISRAREERRAQAAESSSDTLKENDKKNVKDTNSNFYSGLEPSNSTGTLAGRLKMNPLAIEALSSAGDVKATVSKTKESGMSRDMFTPTHFYKKEPTMKKDPVKSEGILLKTSGKLFLVNSVRELSKDLKKSGKIDSPMAVKVEGANGESSTKQEKSMLSKTASIKPEKTGTHCETSRKIMKSPLVCTSVKQELCSNSETSKKIERRSSLPTSVKREIGLKFETNEFVGKSSSVQLSHKQTDKSETFDEVLQRLEKCVYENSDFQVLDSVNSNTSSLSSPSKASSLDSSGSRHRKVKTETPLKVESNTCASSTITSKSLKTEPKKDLLESLSVTSIKNEIPKASVKTEVKDSSEDVPNSDFSSIEPKTEPGDETDLSDFLDDSKSKVRRSVRSSAQKATALICGVSNKPVTKPKTQSPQCTDDEASNCGSMSESTSVSLLENSSKATNINTKTKPKTATKIKKKTTNGEFDPSKENGAFHKIGGTDVLGDDLEAKPSNNTNNSDNSVPIEKAIEKSVCDKEESSSSKNTTVVKRELGIGVSGNKKLPVNNSSVLQAACSSSSSCKNTKRLAEKPTLTAKQNVVRKIKNLTVAKKGHQGKKIDAARKKLLTSRKVKTKIQRLQHKKCEKKIDTAIKKLGSKTKVPAKMQKGKNIIGMVVKSNKVTKKIQAKEIVIQGNERDKAKVQLNEKAVIQNVEVTNKDEEKTEEKKNVLENVEGSTTNAKKTPENEETVIGNLKEISENQEKIQEKEEIDIQNTEESNNSSGKFEDIVETVIERSNETAKSQIKKQEIGDNPMEKDGTAKNETAKAQGKKIEKDNEEKLILKANKSQETEKETENEKKVGEKNREDVETVIGKTDEKAKSQIKKLEEVETVIGKTDEKAKSQIKKLEIGDIQMEKDGITKNETVKEQGKKIEKDDEDNVIPKSLETEKESEKVGEENREEECKPKEANKTGETKKRESSRKATEEKEEKIQDLERMTRSKVLNSPKKGVVEMKERVLEEKDEERKLTKPKAQKKNLLLFYDKSNKKGEEQQHACNEVGDNSKNEESSQIMREEVVKSDPAQDNENHVSAVERREEVVKSDPGQDNENHVSAVERKEGNIMSEENEDEGNERLKGETKASEDLKIEEKEIENESYEDKKEDKSEKEKLGEDIKETKVEREEEAEGNIELRKRREEEMDVQNESRNIKEIVNKMEAEKENAAEKESSSLSETCNETNLNASPSLEDKESSTDTVNEKKDSMEDSSETVINEKEAVPDELVSFEEMCEVQSAQTCGSRHAENDLAEESCKTDVKDLANETTTSESSTLVPIDTMEIEKRDVHKSCSEPLKEEEEKVESDKDNLSVEKPLEDTAEHEKTNSEQVCRDESKAKESIIIQVPFSAEQKTPEKNYERKRKWSENSEEGTPFKLMRITDSADSSEAENDFLKNEDESEKVVEEMQNIEKENTIEKISNFDKPSSCNGDLQHDYIENKLGAINAAECSMERIIEERPKEFNKDNNQPKMSDAAVNIVNEPEFMELEKIEDNSSLIANEKLYSKSTSSVESSEKQSDDEGEHLMIEATDSEDSSKANSKGTASEVEGDELSLKADMKSKAYSEDGNDDTEMEKDEDDTGDGPDDTVEREPQEATSSFHKDELSVEKNQSSSGVSMDGLSPEDSAIKEPFLSALGLGPRAKVLDGREHGYTGTLKTVIKVHRSPEKRGSKFRFMVKKHNNSGASNGNENMDKSQGDEAYGSGTERVEYRIHREVNTAVDPAATDLTNFGLGNRKCLKPFTFRSYFDLSTNSPFLKENAPSTENTDKSGNKDDSKGHSAKAGENLVIPEKSSSFSIHPGRLCSDVCSYCFGKFGSLDTPCHIAQLKNVERQQKILATETHLTADSCLCDACYRHVDRKANCPSYNPSGGRKKMQRSGSSVHNLCVSIGCSAPAVHQVRRKWLVKLKRVLGKKVPVDMEKTALHQPFPLCSQHYYWVEHYMQCGLCKRRLSLNHMYLLGPEVHQLNQALANVSVPVALPEKIFVCKLCRYFCQLCLKYQDQQTLTSCNRMFCENYRKKILYQNEIEISDSDDKSENFMPPKNKRRKTKSGLSTSDGEGKSEKGDRTEKDKDVSTNNNPPVVTLDGGDASNSTDSTDYSRAGASTPTIDYSSLAYPGMNLDILATPAATSVSAVSSKQQHKAPRMRVKVGNTTLDPATEIRPVFSLPAETQPSDQFQMQASFDFRSPYQAGSRKRKGDWEMCNATLQFTKETKKDFISLQRPYGNYSSFIRHLVLLEKYWRSGDLVLSSGASTRATSYISSIETRIKSLDGSLRAQTSTLPAPAPYVPPALPIVTPSVSVLPLPPLMPVVPQPVAVPLPPPPVAVIDLPLRRSATTTTTSSVKPITISTVPVTGSNSPSTSTSSTSVTRIASKPSGKNKPVPNIIQVTTSSGKTYPVYKAFSLQQIKALQQQRKLTQQHQQQQILKKQSQSLQIQPLPPTPCSSQAAKAQTSAILQAHTSMNSAENSSNDFVPMIGDVWSLAPEKSAKLWEKSNVDIISENKSSQSPSTVRQLQTSLSQPKVSVTILPKPPASSKAHGRSSHLVNIAPKPVAVMTSTGILLSRNSEISVSSVSVRREDSSKC